MGIFLDGFGLNVSRAEVALMEVLGFFGLALLGWLLVQLIHWENAFQNNRTLWLRRLQIRARQLRSLRRSLEKAQNMQGLSLPPSLRHKWRVARWITTALSAAPWARS